MRLGIDMGGTKIEILALARDGKERLRRRVPTPQGAYGETIRAIRDLVAAAESELGECGTVGVAIPGAISRKTGLVKNANSTCLIGHPLDKDLEQVLGRQVRVENDANCFALSEAADGAGAGYNAVFGVIAGTGIGGGICIKGRVLEGAHGIAGEWGHNPLPGPYTAEELAGAPVCYCGKTGCIESWCCGPALSAQYKARTGRTLIATDIAKAAREGDPAGMEVYENFLDRFSRGLATLVNVLDPDAIVLGGGLSNIDALYAELPPRVLTYSFMPEESTRILKNLHGDSSGVRGAAWLWHADEAATPAAV
jgi:fructokinase